MKTGSEEASALVEEETQKMCAQKRPPVHSAGSKIRKTHVQIHPWTKTFTLAVKINTLS